MIELILLESTITKQGLGAFGDFWRNEDANMENLCIDSPSIEAESSQYLLGLIPKKSTQKTLRMPEFYRGGEQSSKARLDQILKNLIYNKTDFNTLCQSNHCLHTITGGRGQSCSNIRRHLHEDARQALEINYMRDCSVNRKCYRKVQNIYLQGNFDLQPFLDMDVLLMPQLLAMKNNPDEWPRKVNLSCIYRLIRNCHMPAFFSFPS